jgi:crotonobetainyl-CoA:carnitine CoA-transferase CaiB-like acyl-CoA transferase
MPLQGLVVLDFSRAVAGPYCTMMLGDLGARVIKVEETGKGDETRAWGPPFVEDSHGRQWSTYFVSVNRNKESVELDLKSEEGRSAAQALARQADVVVQNFRTGVAEKLGIGYPELSALNPSVVYCSISGFGPSGPWGSRPGYDLIAQAMSGFMHTSAQPGGDPVKSAFPVADILTALFAEQAILAALYERERTGRGRHVEANLLQSMLAAMVSQTGSYLMTGEEPPQTGTTQPNIVPYQAFRCSDGFVVVAAPNERLWQRVCAALEKPQWLEDPRFATNVERNQNRAALVAGMENVLAERSCANAVALFDAHGIPCAPVSKVGAILDQLDEQGGRITTYGDHEFTATTMTHPVRFAGAQVRYKRPPLLGEHTRVILDSLKDKENGL